MEYLIRRAVTKPELKGLWDGPAWSKADTLEVACFRPESSTHRPYVRARMLYDASNVYGIYCVKDRFVRSIREGLQSSVCQDSCVEFFVEPPTGRGYFNFEFNCGGHLLLYHVRDARRDGDTFADFGEVPAEDARTVNIYHSLPSVVEPEIQAETEWFLEFAAPLAIFEKHMGPIGDPAGQTWRANFYKCGDRTSHPHWASWAPVSELNFHLPQCYQPVRFVA